MNGALNLFYAGGSISLAHGGIDFILASSTQAGTKPAPARSR
jgi:hypothetical protein